MNEHPTVISTSLDSSHLQHLEQLDDEGFWDYVRELAHQAPTAAIANAQGEEYLECMLSRGRCLIPLTTLYELVLPPPPPQRLAQLPATPEWMPGIVAWHGETIAVIDLDMYLSGHATDLTNGMLLIANHAGLPIGLLVSRVGQTRPIQQSTMLHSSLPDQPVHSRGDLLPLPAGNGLSSPWEWCSPSRAALVRGVEAEALVLDISSLLADVVRQIEIAASNG
ncbi:MAG TPA: chemotaxis protein CheW [Ktedonobacteraceae bacterium]|nr:chemotaxis protein CheW [Ktedonobacteraceae bacterium]